MKFALSEKFFFACLLMIFIYLSVEGCSSPADIPSVPQHYNFVPDVENLQAEVGRSVTGYRRVLLTWQFDTTNSNIRSWDVYRSINDTAQWKFDPLGLVNKPQIGFPLFVDSSGVLQFTDTPNIDSLELYYRVVPNGQIRSYIGKPSDILHVIVYKAQ